MFRSAYKVLGVNKHSSSQQVKSAYRKLVKQHHPDLGGCQKKFEEVHKAYKIVKDASTPQIVKEIPIEYAQHIDNVLERVCVPSMKSKVVVIPYSCVILIVLDKTWCTPEYMKEASNCSLLHHDARIQMKVIIL